MALRTKLDGYRAVAFKSGGEVHLRSRNDNDFNRRYPHQEGVYMMTCYFDESADSSTIACGGWIRFDSQWDKISRD